MTTTRWGIAGSTAMALALCIAAPGPLLAFHVGRSPDFPICNVWYSDEGKPLRTKAGREIGEAVPCPGQTVKHDTYSVVAAPMKNTLVIRDQSHKLECLLVLAPGSRNIVVPKNCKSLAP